MSDTVMESNPANPKIDECSYTLDRLEQLAPVLQASREFHGPIIVGGDFNSNWFYWLEHVLPLRRRDARAFVPYPDHEPILL